MGKNFKKAAFSVALAMGAVGQVAAPLANPIVALAAENADLQSALVTSGKFYNANTAAELKDSLEDSLNLQKEVQGVILNQ